MATMMMPRFALLRGLLRRTLQPVNRCKASNSSDTSAPLSASANDVSDAAKTCLIKCLIDQGIPVEASEEIVSRLPNLHVDEDEVYRTMNSLASLQFGQDRLVHLLKTHPGLILTSSDRITKCYCDLAAIFNQNYVYKVLFNSPSVVEQRRSELAEKINYLNKKLGIPNSHIVNSSALSHPMTLIKVRSEFLKRCGLLKPPGKKDEVMTVVDLEDMFNTTDVQFATKVTKLTPIEYEAFLSLYSMEEESDSELESDSDADRTDPT